MQKRQTQPTFKIKWWYLEATAITIWPPEPASRREPSKKVSKDFHRVEFYCDESVIKTFVEDIRQDQERKRMKADNPTITQLCNELCELGLSPGEVNMLFDALIEEICQWMVEEATASKAIGGKYRWVPILTAWRDLLPGDPNLVPTQLKFNAGPKAACELSPLSQRMHDTRQRHDNYYQWRDAVTEKWATTRKTC